MYLFAQVTTLFPAEETNPSPAPTIDRVGFPTDYAKNFTVLRTKTDPDGAKQVTIYGNRETASVTKPEERPYPNGSVLVMETTSLQKDADGKLLQSSDGKYLQDLILGLHVMRRGENFGEAYGLKQSGNWEYVEYRADGTYITPPQKSASCSECHIKAGREKDFVFNARFSEVKN